MHSAAIAALVTAVLLVGGVAVAAGMGALSGHGPFGAGHERPMSGDRDHGYGGMGHGMGHGYGGMMQGDHEGDHDHDEDHDSDDCPCAPGSFQAEWVNATVVSVDSANRYIEVQLGNETLSLRVAMKYVENETGYLVYGPWLLDKLSPGMTVQVLVPSGGPGMGGPSHAPLLGIVLDGRTLVSPMEAHGHEGMAES